MMCGAIMATSPTDHVPDTTIVRLRHISKRYRSGRREFLALNDVSLDIESGEWVAIVGPSGSGKSTLLNILAGIDGADSGGVEVGGRSLVGLSEDRLASWRGRSVGIVFQFFQLMPTLTVVENVMPPMDLTGRREEKLERAMTLLDRVGIADLARNLPSELSGGEQQRAAIARALANEPALLLADEPTGNLDSATGERIVALLAEVWLQGTTIVMVTHDHDVANHATRIVSMRDGSIVEDTAVAATGRKA